MVTILFIALSATQNNFEADWVEAGGGMILRQCPICLRDSIIGHGRRRKQAHDEDHDWIPIRRGLCNLCGKTFTPPQFHRLSDRAGRLVYLVFDQDENRAGQQASHELAQRLANVGVTACIVQLPAGHDPNSYFLAGATAADFTRCLHQARPL